MDNRDLLKSEYDNLYKEIQENATRIYQVLGVCVTASAALLSYVFNIEDSRLPYGNLLPPFLFLIPFLIMIPSSLLVQACQHSTTRIAGYLRVAYEGDDSLVQWQTSIQEYRNDSEHPKRRPFRWALMAVFGGLGLASITSSLVSFIFVCQKHIAHQGGVPPIFAAIYALLISTLSLLLVKLLRLIWKDWGRAAFDAEVKVWSRVLPGPK